jgi:hypothetical protein
MLLRLSHPWFRRLMKNGNVIEASGDANGNAVNVMGCCGTCADDSSLYAPQVIGAMPQMTEKQAMEVLEAAKEAWNGGFGVWPQMSLGSASRPLRISLSS